jgi:hypothetical protein
MVCILFCVIRKIYNGTVYTTIVLGSLHHRTADLGSSRGHAGACTLFLSGHQLCCLWALISPKPPPSCPGFPMLPLLFHPPPHAYDPHTGRLPHTCRLPAHRTRATSHLSFPRPAQPPLLRAILVILFLSPAGARGCCLKINGYWRFVLYYGKANGN